MDDGRLPHSDAATGSTGVARYVPVALVPVASFAVSLAIDIGYGGAVGMTLHATIGFLLCACAIVQLSALPAFARGFRAVDFLARAWAPWGYLFPVAEFALGLLYFSFQWPVRTYTATLVLGAFTLAGALAAVMARRGGEARMLGAPLAAMIVMEGVMMSGMALLLLYL